MDAEHRGSVFDAVGGAPAVLALARAWHARCVADPEASHPFTRQTLHPHHAQRLAAYWGEMLGGPPDYTASLGTEADIVRTHSGNGPHDTLDAAALRCFVAAMDDAELPDDPALRDSLTRWFAWSNELVNHGWEHSRDVPEDLRLARWGWEGPVDDRGHGTVFDAAGGTATMLALAQAWHDRCVADPVAAPAFAEEAPDSEHVVRLAAFWGEMLGGPAAYREQYGSDADVVRGHCGNGPHEAVDQVVRRCFAEALDDVGVTDRRLHDTLARWFAWSNDLVNHGWERPADVPDDLRLPRWSWDGPISPEEA
ncbi:hypothetical protein [Luteimicrobium subarcticum]|uniref:Truncated hemoglobin YjbI n=1 Tax=Luteimicrobium subarcticum TaxID=620910 RepID=A0A2M8W3Y5_9MICO|nr:hypothetical protein [Luteimicrobium subarcticum]PJI85637.1 truncated hemoglobin YjbI [Luteimicrobium subarcticum]